MNIKVFKIRISEEYLQKDESALNQFLSEHTVKKTATSFLNEKENFWSVLVFFEEKNSHSVVENHKTKSSKFFVENESQLTEDDIKIFKTLKQWRFDKAKKLDLPAFMICSNTELMSVAKFKPVKVEEFFEIKGFGENKVEKYGEEILEVLENV